jgi:hypothetical protein
MYQLEATLSGKKTCRDALGRGLVQIPRIGDTGVIGNTVNLINLITSIRLPTSL